MDGAAIRRRRFGEVRSMSVGAVASILFMVWWGITASPIVTRAPAANGVPGRWAVEDLTLSATPEALLTRG